MGKGYFSDVLFFINVEPMINGLVNEIVASSVNYVESSNFWHSRLGHLIFGSLMNMINLELILEHAISNKSRCPIFVSSKINKKTIS